MKLKKYCNTHIGSVYRTNEGYNLEVIDGGSKRNYVTVKIVDYVMETDISQLKNGNVKYPLHPSVCNVGYLGCGEYSKKNNTLSYTKWRSMLARCYDLKVHDVQPAYVGCTVDYRWHNFQVFAKWFYKYHPKDGKKYELDKDIILPGNKIYSPETCMFVPQRLNAFTTNIKLSNKSGYTGVSWHKGTGKWVAQISIDSNRKHIGYYMCARTASIMYCRARENEAKRLKKYYSFDFSKIILNCIF